MRVWKDRTGAETHHVINQESLQSAGLRSSFTSDGPLVENSVKKCSVVQTPDFSRIAQLVIGANGNVRGEPHKTYHV